MKSFCSGDRARYDCTRALEQNREPQPSNESRGMKKDDILRLMNKAKQLRLVSEFVMSVRDVPFYYGDSYESREQREARNSLVLYYPDGGQYGHCVTAIREEDIRDYQHVGGPGFRSGRVVTKEVLLNGSQGTNFIDCTILVKAGEASGLGDFWDQGRYWEAKE
ncbi:uncharacterized protein N7479_005463 [Penicillium vulpinum]|uniref:uncharacterized protein n=1 Tax=Penicillium vulpinum TaxID=29845 RepID=UPI002546E23A|nr:uncharacterized protein N7479_005463 [Penicillium vulpinum]KAJ5958313.1 hypothetical protein N7479_005463 [Penicillium vulpinum]